MLPRLLVLCLALAASSALFAQNNSNPLIIPPGHQVNAQGHAVPAGNAGAGQSGPGGGASDQCNSGGLASCGQGCSQQRNIDANGCRASAAGDVNACMRSVNQDSNNCIAHCRATHCRKTR